MDWKESVIEFGSEVSHEENGTLGTVEYSRFGYSVNFYDTYEGQLIFGKTLAMSTEELLNKYDLIDLPDGYEIGLYGGVYKINNDKS